MRVGGMVLTATLLGGAYLPLAHAGPRAALSDTYSTCMDRAGGVDPEMMACITAETTRQDAALNAAYRRLMAALPPDRQRDLRDAQRLWLKFTEANCRFYDDPGGGTAARLSADVCAMRARASRAVELQRLQPP